jgi:hypothetical protein
MQRTFEETTAVAAGFGRIVRISEAFVLCRNVRRFPHKDMSSALESKRAKECHSKVLVFSKHVLCYYIHLIDLEVNLFSLEKLAQQQAWATSEQLRAGSNFLVTAAALSSLTK